MLEAIPVRLLGVDISAQQSVFLWEFRLDSLERGLGSLIIHHKGHGLHTPVKAIFDFFCLESPVPKQPTEATHAFSMKLVRWTLQENTPLVCFLARQTGTFQDILELMVEVTMVRGAQSGGVVTFASRGCRRAGDLVGLRTRQGWSKNGLIRLKHEEITSRGVQKESMNVWVWHHTWLQRM